MRGVFYVFLGVAMLIAASSVVYGAVPQLINYQGTLLDGSAVPVTTPTSILFAIWDSPTGGDSLWSESQLVTPDARGRFNVILGSVSPIPDSALTGNAHMSLRVGLDPEVSPRQQLVSVPFAYRALDADTAGTALATAPSSVNSVSIVDGAIGLADIGQNGALTDQIMKWNGSAWVVADDEAGGGASGWTDAGSVVRLNTSTDSVGIGTSSPDAKLSVVGNITVSGEATIGSGHTNSGSGGFVAGGSNSASGNWTTISGGNTNDIVGSESSTIGGGKNNLIEYGELSTVGGGLGDEITSSRWAVISGGVANAIDSANWTVVAGGFGNKIARDHHGGAIGGGSFNRIGNFFAKSATGRAVIGDSVLAAAIAGGRNNEVSGSFGAITGGRDNVVSGDYASVSGGHGNDARGYASFAAGSGAHAVHSGSFVWADSADTMASTADNQFLINASGGVGIGTDSPSAQLEVVGIVHSSVGGFRFPDSSVQTTAATATVNSGWTDDGSVVRLGTDTDSVGIGTATPDEQLTVVGNTHIMGNLSVDGTITPSGRKTFDSGWFMGNLSTTYVLPHNLETTTLLVTLYYSSAGNGTNPIVQNIGNQRVNPDGDKILLSPNVYDITATHLTVGTGDAVLAIGGHTATGGGEVTTGFLRVVAMALD